MEEGSLAARHTLHRGWMNHVKLMRAHPGLTNFGASGMYIGQVMLGAIMALN